MRVRSQNVSLSPDSTFRICDVTEEGLVILEPACLADQQLDHQSFASLRAELRQRLGRNGALLVVGPLERFNPIFQVGSHE
jgi:hypothetical protein